MIRTLTIKGLGPHADKVVELSPGGTTEVVGRSESGKTTLIDAACFVLWGVDRNGDALGTATLRGDEVVVALETAKGTVMRRTLRVTPKTRVTKRERLEAGGDGVADEFKTEEAWAEKLGVLGRSGELARLAMVPQSWQRLALGKGGGRPLRDKLLAATARCAVDVRALVVELAGEIYRDGDPVDDTGVTEARRLARSRADQLKGRSAQAAEVLARLDGGRPTGPSRELVDAAQGALAVWPAWTRYRAARESYRVAAEAAMEHEARAEAWQAARAAVGPEPAAPEGADGADERLAAARKAERAAQAERESVRREVQQKAQKVDYARSDLQNLGDAVTDGRAAVCPQCGRDGWVEGEAALADRLAADRERLAEAEAALVEAQGREAAAAVRLSEATAATLAAEDLSDRLQAARKAWAEWSHRVRELGPAPVAPVLPEAPVAPPGEAPALSEAEARQVLADNEAARKFAAHRAREVERAEGEAQRLAADYAAAESEWDRLEALVKVVRRAPSVALDRQLEALGDLGPVALIPTDEGGMEVVVDGRPWQVASDGRLVVADLWLRAGLRRALGLGWLPIFVDRVQDVGGQDLPDVGGPVILLRTTDGDFEVRHG